MIKNIKVVKIQDKTDFSFMTCNIYLVTVFNEITKKIVDTFEICKNKDGQYWSWTANTISQQTITMRDDIAEMLNNGDITLKDNY